MTKILSQMTIPELEGELDSLFSQSQEADFISKSLILQECQILSTYLLYRGTSECESSITIDTSLAMKLAEEDSKG